MVLLSFIASLSLFSHSFLPTWIIGPDSAPFSARSISSRCGLLTVYIQIRGKVVDSSQKRKTRLIGIIYGVHCEDGGRVRVGHGQMGSGGQCLEGRVASDELTVCGALDPAEGDLGLLRF